MVAGQQRSGRRIQEIQQKCKRIYRVGRGGNAKKTTKKAPVKKTVKTSVLTPQNSEELEKAFVKGEQPETVNGPVHIKDELPVYLL